jgi:16S rRNA (guanine527-N7)-methyltransferase
MAEFDDLLAVLATNRAHGSVGEQSLLDAVAHADQFVAALPDSAATIADLGSGGGLPALVIAFRRPDLRITMIERRSNRADQLLRSIRALGFTSHVEVIAEDARFVAARLPHRFDAVTARSFATPAITARWASELLRPSGVLVVSEPPTKSADRWPAEVLAPLALVDLGVSDGVRRLQRQTTTAGDEGR